MRYSVIIPVYNRPDEVDELLQSLVKQHFKDFEVIVVEDGSSVPCLAVTEKYKAVLDLKYYQKSNSGPGQSRNYGAERSQGDFLIILDSDCILPESYFDEVEAELETAPADAFGGPDCAHDSFTDIQKAINYSMTWEVFPRCVLERISILVSGFLREDTNAVCFPVHGCIISGAPI